MDAPGQPQDDEQKKVAEHKSQQWGQYEKEKYRLPASQEKRMPAGFYDCCARQGTDDRVRRTDRKAEIPGDQIPPDPTDKTAEDNVDIDHVRIDKLTADGLGNSGSEDER